MEKTRTKVFQEMLESKGVSPETARQAAVTINNDLFGERTARGQRNVWKAWNQSQDQSQDQSQNQSQNQSQSQENVQ
jgi:hypothetical protein